MVWGFRGGLGVRVWGLGVWVWGFKGSVFEPRHTNSCCSSWTDGTSSRRLQQGKGFTAPVDEGLKPKTLKPYTLKP